VLDEHDAVEHRDAEQRDEADARREVEVEPAQPERRDAADQAKGTLSSTSPACETESNERKSRK
jgi:hypothetical protein